MVTGNRNGGVKPLRWCISEKYAKKLHIFLLHLSCIEVVASWLRAPLIEVVSLRRTKSVFLLIAMLWAFLPKTGLSKTFAYDFEMPDPSTGEGNRYLAIIVDPHYTYGNRWPWVGMGSVSRVNRIWRATSVLPEINVNDPLIDDYFVKLFEEFVFGQYLQRGRMSPEQIELFKATEFTQLGKSRLILITHYDDPSNILASLRIAFPSEEYPGREKVLPVESRLGIHLEKPGSAEGLESALKNPEPRLVPQHSEARLESWVSDQWVKWELRKEWSLTPLYWPHSAAELKNFVVRKSLGIDWVPMLFHLAELFHVAIVGPDTLTYNKNPPELSVRPMPRIYYLECDALMKRYYENTFGFEVYQQIDEDTFIMRISREGWATKMRQIMQERLNSRRSSPIAALDERKNKSGTWPIRKKELIALLGKAKKPKIITPVKPIERSVSNLCTYSFSTLAPIRFGK